MRPLAVQKHALAALLLCGLLACVGALPSLPGDLGEGDISKGTAMAVPCNYTPIAGSWLEMTDVRCLRGVALLAVGVAHTAVPARGGRRRRRLRYLCPAACPTLPVHPPLPDHELYAIQEHG